MRITFLLLVFANLAFFAWARGYLGAVDAGREPQRLAAQLNPGKLRVLSNAPPVVELCRTIGKLHPADAQRLVSLLGQKLPGATARVIPSAAVETWDVVITGLANRAAVEARLADLKKAGVADARLITDAKSGEFRLQLASEPKQAAAEDRLKELAKKGVKSAKVLQRPPTDETSVQVRGPAAALTPLGAQFTDLTRDIPGAVIADCPAN